MAEHYVQSNNPRINIPRPRSPSQLAAGRVRAGKIAWIALLSGLPGLVFYGYLHYSETAAFPTLEKNATGFFASAAIGIIVGSSLYALNRMLDRRIPWSDYFSYRFLAGYSGNVALSIGMMVLASVLITSWGTPVFWEGFNLDDPDLTWKVFILVLVFVFIYNVIYALLYAYQHYAVAQLDQLRNERHQLELQFEALKSQISPHYLFNSLNTISSLLFQDLPSAEQFIRRLVQTYQYILATRDKKSVLLSEELEFVESYYYLLRIRFQQQLNVEINVPVGIMNTRVPPLTLQMLVENAVKHNTLSGDKKLFIYISAREHTYLQVANTRTGVTADVESFNVGLENIRQRYRYLTEKRILVESNERFMVSLPVIHDTENKTERKHSA